MKPRTVGPWAAWTAGAALVAAAWVVVHLTPAQGIDEAPFVVSAAVGEPATARAFTATVTGARLADRAVAGAWSAEGSWLIVDIEAAAVREEQGARLSGMTFTAGGRTYTASERPAGAFDSFAQTDLSVGLAQTGSVAFELADDVSGSGMLHLSLNTDTRLDSLIEVAIDLDQLPHTDEAELLEKGWAQ